VFIYPKNAEGIPEKPYHLLVARNVLKTDEIKYFVSNAEEQTPVRHLLLVAFSRWRIERCFEDQKGEVGLDHYEGRRWLGLQRHLVLSALSYLFLAETCHRLRGKKPGVDRLPSAYRDGVGRQGLVARRTGRRQTVRASG
jgi:SRSO17 transposase